MMKSVGKPKVSLSTVGALVCDSVFVCTGLLLISQMDYFQAQNDFITRSDLVQIGQALDIYAAAHADTLPPMQNVTVFKSALLPYMDAVSQQGVQYASRTDQRPFQTNALLSQRKCSSIKASDKTIVLFQSQPERFGRRRWVLFLSGTPRLISEADWPAVKQASGMR